MSDTDALPLRKGLSPIAVGGLIVGIAGVLLGGLGSYGTFEQAQGTQNTRISAVEAAVVNERAERKEFEHRLEDSLDRLSDKLDRIGSNTYSTQKQLEEIRKGH